jgi:O-Antigen ligase
VNSLRDFFTYKNPGMLSMALLFMAFSFNDWYSLTFGFPTPIQLAIVFGIYHNLRYKTSIHKGYDGTFLTWLAIFYFFIIISNTIFDWDKNPSLLFVSIGFNLLWLMSVLPLLSMGIEQEDWRKFCNLILLVVFIVTIPSGCIELITGKNVLDTQYGISSDIFYLRGLHIDKLEFGSILSLAGFIAFVDLVTKSPQTQYRTWKISIVVLVSLLLTFSFSTTSMLGFASGIFVILLYMNRKYLVYVPVIALLSFMASQIVQNTSLFQSQQSSYQLKYKLNIEMYDEKNFRYLAIDAALDKIQESFIMGYGVGQSGAIIKKALGTEKEINTHNFFGNELLDYGLLGFIPITIFLYIVFKLSFRVRPDQPTYINQMSLLNKATSVFLMFRFMLYYHRFDQAFYVIWVALVVIYIASINNQTYLSDESTSVR